VMIALLSFLIGMITDLYGITERRMWTLMKNYNSPLIMYVYNYL
jgi:hypothetical protein